MGLRGPQGAEEEKVINLGLAPPKERPKAPETWEKDRIAWKTWVKIVQSMPADHFRAADLPLLEKYCLAEEIYHRALDNLSESLTITTTKGYELPDTMLTIMNKQVTIQTQLATKLRITPNSRITNNQAGHSKEDAPKSKSRQRLMFGGRYSE